MRIPLVLAAVSFGLAGLASPANATCMERPGPAGISFVSCAAPGGPVHSYICYHDTCYQMPYLGSDEGPPGGDH